MAPEQSKHQSDKPPATEELVPSPGQPPVASLPGETPDDTQPAGPASKYRKKKLLVSILVLILIVGIGSVYAYTRFFDRALVQEKQAGQAALIPSTLAEAHSAFGVAMLQQLHKPLNDSGENIFISPSSIALALSMVYEGAAGDTKTQMQSVLSYSTISDEELRTYNQQLLAKLKQSSDKVQTSVANTIWADKPDASNDHFTIRADFQNRLQQYYASESKIVDLQADSTKDTVNQWVSDNTKGKIPKLLSQRLPNDYRFLLINAIYFKGTWQYQFDTAATEDDEFTASNGSKSQVPMMSQTETFKYHEVDGLQAVQLPYGDEGEYVMEVILPENMNAFSQNMNTTRLSDITSKLADKEGIVRLPRFTIEYEQTLNTPLIALGMVDAFSNDADLSGISEVATKIDEVKHKTFLEVNEEGTEAAGVTSVGGAAITSAGPPSDTFYMNVDKPFFIVIKDVKSNAPLFMGIINSVR